MKKIRNLFVLTLAATLMISCAGLNKMKKNAGDIRYDVKPPILETHGCLDCIKQVEDSRPTESRMTALGMVPVTISGTFPEKYFDKKATLTLTPVIKYEGGEVPFPSVQILQGEKVQSNNRMISYSGGNFTYSSAVPYISTVSRTNTPISMKKSELILKATAERNGKTLDFDPIKLADGVIATSTLVERSAVKAIIMPDRFQRITPETGVAEIPYIIQRYDIQSKTLRADDILALKQYINDVNEDPNRQFKTTVVSSYASPEGPLALNESLSANRGKTADKFIRSEFQKIEAAQAAGFFDEKLTAEDWDGFRTELEKSNIRDKDLILRVLSMYSDPIVREREIKNMSAAYDVLKTDILPQLRRSKMVVNVDKIGLSDEQILAAMRSNSRDLNIEEMLYSATLTNNLSEKLKFYQAAAEAFPTCIRAQNNIGYTYLAIIEAGVVLENTGGGRAPNPADLAIAAFEKARAMENNDIVKNNLGMGSLAKGEFAKAEEYFTSMSSATPESRWGLGTISIVKGEYDQAVNYFGSTPCVNNALALILKGDYTRAKTMLDGMQDPCKGKRDYFKAVVGARLDDRTYMLNGLRGAINADANWKDYAKTDWEFGKYFNDDTFISTIQ